MSYGECNYIEEIMIMSYFDKLRNEINGSRTRKLLATNEKFQGKRLTEEQEQQMKNNERKIAASARSIFEIEEGIHDVKVLVDELNWYTHRQDRQIVDIEDKIEKSSENVSEGGQDLYRADASQQRRLPLESLKCSIM